MTLRELAKALGAELVGAQGGEEVLGAAGLDSAAAGHVVYVEDARRLAEAESGEALAIIAPSELSSGQKPVLRVANPRLAFARSLALLHPAPRLRPGIHPSAEVGANVQLGEEVSVAPYCVIGDAARIGRGAQLYALVSVGRGVEVGENCVLFPHVTLYDGVRLGARVVVHAGSVIGSPGFGYACDGEEHVPIPHIGTVLVEDDVEIGANVTIDRGTTGATVIGKGTKIDNLVQVAHNVKIGRRCILAGQVGISGSVTLGDGVVLAGQAGVADHVTMGEGSAAAAGADVIRSVPAGTVVLGRPARPLREQLRIDAAAGRLPALLREIRELRRRVSALEEPTSDGGRGSA